MDSAIKAPTASLGESVYEKVIDRTGQKPWWEEITVGCGGNRRKLDNSVSRDWGRKKVW